MSNFFIENENKKQFTLAEVNDIVLANVRKSLSDLKAAANKQKTNSDVTDKFFGSIALKDVTETLTSLVEYLRRRRERKYDTLINQFLYNRENNNVIDPKFVPLYSFVKLRSKIIDLQNQASKLKIPHPEHSYNAV